MISLLTIIWVIAFIYLAIRHADKVVFFLTLILPTYLVKFWIVGIPTTWLELAIYAVFLAWAIRKQLDCQKVLWIWQEYKIPLILLGLGLFVGSVFSTQITVSLGIVKGWFVDPVLLGLILLSSKNSTNKIVRQASLGLVVSGFVLSLFAIGQVVSGNFITIDQRASAWFTSANYLSLFLVPVMIMGGALFNKSSAGIWRTGLIMAEIIMAVAVYFTFSYAGWLALLIGVLTAYLLIKPNWISVAWWCLGLVGVVVSQWHHPKFQQMLDLAGRSSSHVRLQVWQTTLLMIKQHWFTGIGLGLFEQRYLEFAKQIFHPPIELIMLHSHNIFLQFWINLGVLGFIGFVWLLVKWIKHIWSLIREHNMITITIFAAMVALLVQGMLDVAYWKNDLSALFWIIFTLGVILHGQRLSYRD